MMHLAFLAARTLLFRRGSFVLLLTAITGALGLQISNSANVEGYSAEIFNKGILPSIGHILVTNSDAEPVRGRANIVTKLSSQPDVATVAPRFLHPAVLFHRTNRQPINATGVVATAEEQANHFCGRLASGRCFSSPGARELVLGHRLGADLKVAVGDTATLVLPFEDLDGVRYVKERFTIVGLLRPLGGFTGVEHAAFLPIDVLCSLVEDQDAFTSLHVYLKQGRAAEAVADGLQRVTGPSLSVRAWPQAAAGIVPLIESSRSVNRISQAMVVLAILLPTLALLWINVIREQRQIAAMQAIGFTRQAVFTVYLMRASFLGILGSLLGLATGLLLCVYFREHPIYYQNGFSIVPLLRTSTLVESVALALLITTMGGMAPALHAAFSNPTMTMRGP